MKTSIKNGVAKIYIGNLPPRCTERDIEDLCKQFGSLERADIVKNFAFVIFNSKDAAHEAVERLHDSTFQGVRIQVEMARSKLHVDDKDDNQCYECGQKGHWARECPKRLAKGGRRGPPAPPPPRGSSRRELPPSPRSRAPPPRDTREAREPREPRESRDYYYERPPPRSYDDYPRGYDYDRPVPRGYESYDRALPPARRPVEYAASYRGRSRSPPPVRREYLPPRSSDPYARDPYARDPYYSRESYSRGDAYSRDPYPRSSDPYARSSDPYARSSDPYARSSDPYASYRQPQDSYASPYSTSQAKRYSDSSAPPRSAAGRY